MTLRRVLAAALVLGGLLAPTGAARADDVSRTFEAPADRVFTVTRSVLRSLGWDIDKEDRDVGWIVTDSRRLDGDDYGVYAKGVKHRLRVTVKRVSGSRSAVSVERRVYKEERILFVDKEEDLKTDDRSVETRILDEIGRSL
ncbi:MAG TPA: hypothetical protein VFE48_19225 [Methylomirabilota bacterium]|nr:hypothetical protein [Methylomirabilota bacterium]